MTTKKLDLCFPNVSRRNAVTILFIFLYTIYGSGFGAYIYIFFLHIYIAHIKKCYDLRAIGKSCRESVNAGSVGDDGMTRSASHRAAPNCTE